MLYFSKQHSTFTNSQKEDEKKRAQLRGTRAEIPHNKPAGIPARFIALVSTKQLSARPADENSGSRSDSAEGPG